MSECAWWVADCCVHVVWTPWQCCCMWPLLVAVDCHRWWRIRWGVRSGIIVSLELCTRAQRSVGVGGEHNACCIYSHMVAGCGGGCNLVDMAVRGNAVVRGVVGGIIHNPVRIAATQNCAASMRNSTLSFCEEDLAPCIAECHHTNKGVQCQACNDVGKVHYGWEVR
jgi:hypothetical protein